MRYVLASVLALGFPMISEAAVSEDYTLSCRVSGNEASASLSSEASFVELRGSVRVEALDWNDRVIEEHTVQTTAEARPSQISRIAAVSVSYKAQRCRLDASQAKIWVDG